MNKKQEVVNYLLEVKSFMERERGRVINYTEFSKVSRIPFKTTTALFDPDDPRLPSKNNAEKIAILTGSNRINEILGYDNLDPNYISMMRMYRQLKPEQQEIVLRYMRNLDGISVRAVA